MILPKLAPATLLDDIQSRIYIGAYGFEDRSYAWMRYQNEKSNSGFKSAVVFKYANPKRNNKTAQLKKELVRSNFGVVLEPEYDVDNPHSVEAQVQAAIREIDLTADEIVVDVSAMTKLLILLVLLELRRFKGTVRIIYVEDKEYPPTQADYKSNKLDMAFIARCPSQGVNTIVRPHRLASVRMQGEPVTMVAFTSFNEQLVRSMLGSISPHRLLFINGRPPRPEYAWRETATQYIYSKLIQQYARDNEVDGRRRLRRVTSTLEYAKTYHMLDTIYNEFGLAERIICAATGSKMQTLGLFMSKIAHPDIHIEYPTPDSYFHWDPVEPLKLGHGPMHEILIPKFSQFLTNLEKVRWARVLELQALVKR